MDLQKVADRLKRSKSPVILTGAGVSAESGVPTFRGPEGLWRDNRAEDLATPEAFDRDPALVWQWYDWRRSLISGLSPNPAHYAIAEMEKRFGAFLITQNVDGLHRAAGSINLIELHGSIWQVRCTGCNRSSENREVPIDIPPRCPCGALLRPGVVWFGEALPEGELGRAFAECEGADFMIVAGTSGVVQPAASLANMAKRAGAFLVEVNKETTAQSGVMDIVLRGPAGEILPGLLDF